MVTKMSLTFLYKTLENQAEHNTRKKKKIIKNKGKNNREKESVETGMNNITRQVADYLREHPTLKDFFQVKTKNKEEIESVRLHLLMLKV